VILVALAAAGRPALHAQDPDLLEVDVTVRGIARLYGADISLRYDPEQVSLVDSMSGRPGTQILAGRGWGPAPFVLFNEADVAAGTVHFAALLMAPAAALEGDVVIATLRFAPRRLEPEDAWALTAVELVDRRGQLLEADWEVLEIHPRIDWPRMRAWSFLPRLDG
jgi:hypothetical protein